MLGTHHQRGTIMGVWDQLFGTIVWTMGPAVVWDHAWGPYCLGPSFDNLGPCVFGTMVWDHGCLDHRLGAAFGTMYVWDPTIWDYACLGP